MLDLDATRAVSINPSYLLIEVRRILIIDPSYLLIEVRRILIIDLDVHQGNGNASLFKAIPEVYTFSMHCRQNLFSAREISDLDVDLEAGTGDVSYLATLTEHLPRLIDGAWGDDTSPDLIFFQVKPKKSYVTRDDTMP